MGLGLAKYIPIVVYIFFWVSVGLTILYRTEIGLMFMVPLFPLQNLLQKLHVFPYGKDVIDIMILALLLGWFIRSVSLKDRILVKTSPNIPIFILILITYIGLWRGSAYLGIDAPIHFNNPRLLNWKNFILLPLLYLITVNNIKDKKTIIILTVLMLCSMLIVDRSFHRQFQWVERYHYTHDMRVQGTFSYLGPNELAAFICEYSMIVLSLLIFSKKKILKAFYTVILLGNTYALLYLFSRAAYLAFVIGLFFIGILKERKILILLFILICSWTFILPVSVQERIRMTWDNSEDQIQSNPTENKLDPSSEARLTLSYFGFDLFKESPIFGVGYNVYIYLSSEVDKFGRPRDAHDNYIKILSELGLIGFLLYLLLYYFAFKSGWQLYRASDDNFLKGLGFGFATCVITNMVLNTTHDNWSYLNSMGYYWVFWGLVARGNLIVKDKQLEIKHV